MSASLSSATLVSQNNLNDLIHSQTVSPQKPEHLIAPNGVYGQFTSSPVVEVE